MSKLFVFDFDGTIADSGPVIFNVIRELAPKYGYSIDQDYKFFRSMTIKQAMKHFKIKWWTAAFLIYKVRKYAYRRTVHMFPRMRAVLDYIRDDAILLTKNKKRIVRDYWGKQGMKNPFKKTVQVFSLASKNIAFQQLKKNQGRFIYVGDEYEDITACRSAGVEIIAVTWGFNTKELLQSANPDYIVDTPDELLELIKKLNES